MSESHHHHHHKHHEQEESRIREFSNRSHLPWKDLLAPDSDDDEPEELLGVESNYYDLFSKKEKLGKGHVQVDLTRSEYLSGLSDSDSSLSDSSSASSDGASEKLRVAQAHASRKHSSSHHSHRRDTRGPVGKLLTPPKKPMSPTAYSKSPPDVWDTQDFKQRMAPVIDDMKRKARGEKPLHRPFSSDSISRKLEVELSQSQVTPRGDDHSSSRSTSSHRYQQSVINDAAAATPLTNAPESLLPEPIYSLPPSEFLSRKLQSASDPSHLNTSSSSQPPFNSFLTGSGLGLSAIQTSLPPTPAYETLMHSGAASTTISSKAGARASVSSIKERHKQQLSDSEERESIDYQQIVKSAQQFARDGKISYTRPTTAPPAIPSAAAQQHTPREVYADVRSSINPVQIVSITPPRKHVSSERLHGASHRVSSHHHKSSKRVFASGRYSDSTQTSGSESEMREKRRLDRKAKRKEELRREKKILGHESANELSAVFDALLDTNTDGENVDSALIRSGISTNRVARSIRARQQTRGFSSGDESAPSGPRHYQKPTVSSTVAKIQTEQRRAASATRRRSESMDSFDKENYRLTVDALRHSQNPQSHSHVSSEQAVAPASDKRKIELNLEQIQHELLNVSQVLMAKNESLSARESQIRERTARLPTEVEQLKDAIRKQESQYRRVLKRAEQLDHDNMNLSKEIQKRATQVELLEKSETRIAKLQADLQKVQKKLVEATKQIHSLTADRETLTTRVKVFERDSKKLRSLQDSKASSKEDDAQNSILTVLLDLVMQSGVDLQTASLNSYATKSLPMLAPLLSSLQDRTEFARRTILQYTWMCVRCDTDAGKSVLSATFKRICDCVTIAPFGKTPLIQSEDLETRMICTLLILKLQHDHVRQTDALESLKKDLTTDDGRKKLLDLSGIDVLIPLLKSTTANVSTGAACCFLALCSEGPALSRFLALCGNETWFRAAGLAMTRDLPEVQEMLSVVLEKLSRVNANKRFFEAADLLGTLMETERGTKKEFLRMNLRSIIKNVKRLAAESHVAEQHVVKVPV